MTMLSFRIEDEEAAQADRWANRLGQDRSALLRAALQRHLAWLQNEADAARWEELPHTTDEQSFAEIADLGPAEDWSDWEDEAR